jgi:hypothetical protein
MKNYKTSKVDNYHEAPQPACETCIHRKVCEHRAENSFCTRWQSKEPQPVPPDPNELWKQGEEVEF